MSIEELNKMDKLELYRYIDFLEDVKNNYEELKNQMQSMLTNCRY